MAGLQMPGYLDYGSMMQMNPQAYGQAMSQVSLANQFAQEQIKQAEAQTLADVTKNTQAEQMNPLLLEEKGLANIGRRNENTISGVNANMASQLEPEMLKQKRQEFLTKADEDTLKQMEAKGKAMMMRVDRPDEQERGQAMMDASWGELERRRKAQDDLNKAKVQGDARLEGIQMAQQGMDRRTQITQEGMTQRAQEALMAKAKAAMNPKENFQQASVRLLDEASKAPSQEARAAALEKLSVITQLGLNQGMASSGGKVDLNALGVQTNTVPNAAPSSMRTPLAQPQPTNAAERSMAPGVMEAIGQINPDVEIARTQEALQYGNLDTQMKKAANEYLASMQNLKLQRQGQAVPKGQAAPVSKLPSGARQIGTSKGRPVYQTPDGQRFLGE